MVRLIAKHLKGCSYGILKFCLGEGKSPGNNVLGDGSGQRLSLVHVEPHGACLLDNR